MDFLIYKYHFAEMIQSVTVQIIKVYAINFVFVYVNNAELDVIVFLFANLIIVFAKL